MHSRLFLYKKCDLCAAPDAVQYNQLDVLFLLLSMHRSLARILTVLAMGSLQLPTAYGYTFHNLPGIGNVTMPGMEQDHSDIDTSPDVEFMPNSENTDFESVFFPEGTLVTRAELAAAIADMIADDTDPDTCFTDLLYQNPDASIRYDLLFADTPIDHQYAKQICVGMLYGVIHGYPDGNFRPDAYVNVAEAAKMLSRAFALSIYPNTDPNAPWYWDHIKVLSDRNAIPEEVRRLTDPMRSVDLMEMIERVREQITWRPHRSAEDLMAAS